MRFLVEIDHVNSGVPVTPESGRAFIEQIILPTLAPRRLSVGSGPHFRRSMSLSWHPVTSRGVLPPRIEEPKNTPRVLYTNCMPYNMKQES